MWSEELGAEIFESIICAYRFPSTKRQIGTYQCVGRGHDPALQSNEDIFPFIQPSQKAIPPLHTPNSKLLIQLECFLSFSIILCSVVRASFSPPSLSMSPEATASLPYRMVPTSVAISPVAII